MKAFKWFVKAIIEILQIAALQSLSMITIGTALVCVEAGLAALGITMRTPDWAITTLACVSPLLTLLLYWRSRKEYWKW